jgi:restriction system protein
MYAPEAAMTIPDYQTVMLPLLRLASDEQEHSVREAIEKLADQFELSEQERKELLPSGRQATFDNRVGWARTYMKKAGLLESKRRGYFKITGRGLEVLQKGPQAINVKFLEQYPEFIEFRTKRTTTDKPTTSEETQEDKTQTPEEAIEAAYQAIRNNLASDLIQQIMECSPSFFERMVVDLLVKMGYGGTRTEAGQAVGRSGDEGIDGIINEDRLGLDVIYIQAKRWEGPVGRPEIQKFVGALQGQRAKKGVFITTSSFSKQAVDYASMIESNVVLINGETLAKLMIDNNVGVSPVAAYEIRRVDSDYFNEA